MSMLYRIKAFTINFSNMSPFLVICFLLINSALSSSFTLVDRTIFKHTMQNRICKTTGCIKAARTILENMDTSVDPCDNFYRFACGKYIETSLIQDDKSSASILGQADDRLEEQLKPAIEDKIDKNDCRTLQLLQTYYNTCMDVEKIEKTSIKVLLNILDELGGWPVLVGKSWNESSFDWKNLTYHLRRLGYTQSMNSLLKFDIAVDEKNSTRYVIMLDEASTGVAHEYLVNGREDEVIKAYYKYMIKLAKVLGGNVRHAKRELNESLLFEIELAKISSSAEERRNMSQFYNPMTVEELQSKYSDIPWSEYLNEFLRPHQIIEMSERVIIRNPNYLKSMTDLISRTPKRVLANYIIWRVIQESASFLNKKVLRYKAQFEAAISGTNGQYPRWEKCLLDLTDNVPLGVGALYARKVFDKNLKKKVEELVVDLRKSFKNLLEKVDWMNIKTKGTALKKLKFIHAHVAYPDELFDDDKLDEFFKKLKAVPDNYLDSYLSLTLFDLDDTYQQLKKPINKTEWMTHGSTAVVNSFYDLSENSIEIPAGFFQEELFALDRPNYMNYAGIGFFIGHELTHGFDDEGSQYDEEGNLVNWWDPKTKKEYQKRAQCIIDQYSNYTVGDVNMNLNGINTQGENIADNGGIKEAYFAYEEYEKRNGPEPRLPGLPYSSRQMFWISTASVWCEVNRHEALEDSIITDPHSPSEFRVIGPLSNTPEFSRDFNCPLGSFMNPVKKCTVW